MTLTSAPDNSLPDSPITAESVFAALAIAVTDRSRAIPDWDDGDPFGNDQDRVNSILNNLFEHALCEEHLSEDALDAFRIAIRQFADNHHRVGAHENSVALRVVEMSIELFQYLANEAEAGTAASGTDPLLLQIQIEQKFQEIVKLLMRAGFTESEVMERIANHDYDGRW